MDDSEMVTTGIVTMELGETHPEMMYESWSPEEYMKDAKKEEDDFGYYVDMLRGYMNCDTKIMSLAILDGILDKIEYENTQSMSPLRKGQPGDVIYECPQEPVKAKNIPIPMPTPILPHTGKLFCDLSNAAVPVSTVGANLRYVDINLSTGTALRNVDPLEWGSGLNKQVKPCDPPATPSNQNTHNLRQNTVNNFVKRLDSPQEMKKIL